jgi:hypothetical protein
VLAEIQLIEVTFSLPEWTADKRFDEEIPVFYDSGHAWKGQIKNYKNENAISDGLFEIKGVKEVCLDPMSQWVTVEFGCDLGDIHVRVGMFLESLRKFLQNKRWIRFCP